MKLDRTGILDWMDAFLYDLGEDGCIYTPVPIYKEERYALKQFQKAGIIKYIDTTGGTEHWILCD